MKEALLTSGIADEKMISVMTKLMTGSL